MLISGEPGIGKSRIAQTIVERLERRAAHPLALFLLAPPPGQRALPDHHAARTGGRLPARGYGRATARQAGGGARSGDQRSQRGRPAAGGLAVDPDRRPLPAAQSHPAEAQGEDASGAVGAGRGAGGAAAGADGVRGRPLERPHHARVARPAHRSGAHAAGPGDHHLPAGVHAAVDRPSARDHAQSQSPAASASAPR